MNDDSKPVYIWDDVLQRQINKIAVIKGRANLVHNLISAYGLLSELDILPSEPASHKCLCRIHSKDYVDILRQANKSGFELSDEIADNYNLGYDCPLLPRMYNFVRVVAGASLQAAKALCNGKTIRAINWQGGWHHAQRDGAQGFCYVNDIAVAINELLNSFPRVLYIDLDVHHGNGVENLFSEDPRVMTLSLHLSEPGFFPCTGNVDDVGHGEGKFYSVNVPLKAGLSNQSLISIFDKVSSLVHKKFVPSAVVVQCGADCLNKDPLGHFAVTLQGVGHCVEKILTWNLPTLFLGGGGYHLANAARLWTFLTSIILGKSISNEIPEHKYFDRYGQGYSYELHITAGQREDLNTAEYLTDVYDFIEENLQQVSSKCDQLVHCDRAEQGN